MLAPSVDWHTRRRSASEADGGTAQVQEHDLTDRSEYTHLSTARRFPDLAGRASGTPDIRLSRSPHGPRLSSVRAVLLFTTEVPDHLRLGGQHEECGESIGSLTRTPDRSPAHFGHHGGPADRCVRTPEPCASEA